MSETARGMRAAQPYISAVWKLTGGAVVGVVGGFYLDRWLGTGPWLLVGLSLAGISVGFYGLIKDLSSMGKK